MAPDEGEFRTELLASSGAVHVDESVAESLWLWWCHKRAFVTLGHKSLTSACLGVGRKGIVQSAAVGGRAMPETYGYIRTSRTRVSELSGSAPETQRQQMLATGLSGLPARLGRHLGCGVHGLHLAALTGYHGQHPRSATVRGDGA